MTDKMPGKDPEQKNILRLYAASCVMIVFSFIPTITAALTTLLLFTFVLIAAYVMRRKSEEHSLTENHTTYIIRTIWISGLIAVLSLTAGSFYMLGHIDQNPLNGCANTILGMSDPNAMLAVMQPCIDEFVALNKQVLMISGAIVAAPVLLYLILRYARGLPRAIRGYRIAHEKGWF